MIQRIVYSLFAAIQMIWSKRFRSLLSVLGVLFGVATLLITVSVAQGTKARVLDSIEAFGDKLVKVTSQPTLGKEGIIQFHPFHEKDFTSLRDTLEGIELISPVFMSSAMIQSKRGDSVFGVFGVNEDYIKLRDLSIEQGRSLIKYDLDQKENVCLIGSGVHRTVGEDSQWIYLWKTPFRVVGVLDMKGSGPAGNINKIILVPLSTLQELLGKTDQIQEVWIKAKSIVNTEFVIQQIKNHFNNQVPTRQDIEIWNQELILAEKEKITKAFTIALGSIALISLLIGGIGVMNMLLVTVAERIHEIGLRKAMGAYPMDILLQFLFESIMLCTLGFMGGVFLGLVLADTVTYALNHYLRDVHPWQAHVSWKVIGVAFQFTFFVGLFFGLYPAWKAAKMDPTEALTYH